MELIKRTEQYVRPNKPFLTVSEKGVIRLSKKVAEMLKLKKNDEIAFYQDKNNPSDWYIKPHEAGLFLRSASGTTNALMCNSASIAKSILECIKKSGSAKMLVSPEPQEGGYYAVITKSAV